MGLAPHQTGERLVQGRDSVMGSEENWGDGGGQHQTCDLVGVVTQQSHRKAPCNACGHQLVTAGAGIGA